MSNSSGDLTSDLFSISTIPEEEDIELDHPPSNSSILLSTRTDISIMDRNNETDGPTNPNTDSNSSPNANLNVHTDNNTQPKSSHPNKLATSRPPKFSEPSEPPPKFPSNNNNGYRFLTRKRNKHRSDGSLIETSACEDWLSCCFMCCFGQCRCCRCISVLGCCTSDQSGNGRENGESEIVGGEGGVSDQPTRERSTGYSCQSGR